MENPVHEKLREVLTRVAGEPLVILLTGHPDPDAIGSALAHQHICRSVGVPATIAHVQPISHRENRALVKLLGIDMLLVDDPHELERFRHLSLVDSTFPDPGIAIPDHLRLLTVVDHHRSRQLPEVPFADLRPQCGAASTMYAEYLQAGLAPLDGQQTEAVRTATALLFGIQTDTDDFTLATASDFSAAAYLRPFCDGDVLKRVGRRTISAAAMEVLGRALANLTVVRDFAMAGVGVVPVADRDAIGSAADHLLLREDIDTVLVYGLVGGHVDGSLRTNSASVDPAVFLGAAFGSDPQGRPYGGGRADKGGFQIPVGMLADGEDQQLLWELVQQVVRARLVRVMPDLRGSLAPPSRAGDQRDRGRP